MMHAALSRLLSTVPYDTEGAGAALDPARSVVASSAADFELRALAVPQREGGADRVHEVRAAIARLTDVLDRIGEELRARGIGMETAHALAQELQGFEDALVAFDQFEQSLPRQSPMPLVDRFIGVGVNVRDGFVAAGPLRDMLELLTQTTVVLAADSSRFRLLYPEAARHADAFDEAYRVLEAGAAAARAWGEGEDPQTLLDAMRLLKAGSTALMDRLGEMDAYVRQHARFSTVVAVEEVLRCAEGVRAGTLPLDVFSQAVTNLVGLVGFYEGALRTADGFPLAFAMREALSGADERTEALLQVARPWTDRAQADPRGAAADAATLDAVRVSLEAAAQAHAGVQESMDDLLRLFARAPQVLDVVAALGRVTSGAATVEQALDRSTRFLTACHALQDELRQQGNAESFELRALLAGQSGAIEQMQVYLVDRDEAHLVHGVETLRSVVPRLGELHQTMRAQADEQRRARERTLTCFRCGTGNPSTSRYCSKCNAMLPALAPEETTFTDIVGGEEPTAMPGNLHRLQSLYDEAEDGADLEDVAARLYTLLGELQTVARTFAERFGPPAPSSPWAVTFGQQLGALMDAVANMVEGARNARLDWMAQALRNALEAGEAMQEAQQDMHLNASV